METTTNKTDPTSILLNDSLTSIVADEDEDLATDTYEDDAKWYRMAMLVLAVVGLAINLTAIILMRKKKGIFHKMLKVNNTQTLLKYLHINY